MRPIITTLLDADSVAGRESAGIEPGTNADARLQAGESNGRGERAPTAKIGGAGTRSGLSSSPEAENDGEHRCWGEDL